MPRYHLIKVGLTCRFLRDDEMIDLSAIESLDAMALPDEWEQFCECVDTRIVVAERDGVLLGAMAVMFFPNATVIRRIVVMESCRRGGVATAMVRELVGSLEACDSRVIVAEMLAEGTRVAQAFFRATGFEAVRKGAGATDAGAGAKRGVLEFVRKL